MDFYYSLMNKIFIVIILVLFFFPFHAEAKSYKNHLNQVEIERVKVFKAMIDEVDKKSLDQMIADLEKTSHPLLNLEIKEAMAKTYVDIIREEKVSGRPKKEWLYSMIALNMAYFQFGGDKDSASGSKNLNKLIRSKLKEYLPVNIYTQVGFHASIE